jgi:hypothetical protein
MVQAELSLSASIDRVNGERWSIGSDWEVLVFMYDRRLSETKREVTSRRGKLLDALTDGGGRSGDAHSAPLR